MEAFWTVAGSLAGIGALVVGILQLRQSRATGNRENDARGGSGQRSPSPETGKVVQGSRALLPIGLLVLLAVAAFAFSQNDGPSPQQPGPSTPSIAEPPPSVTTTPEQRQPNQPTWQDQIRLGDGYDFNASPPRPVGGSTGSLYYEAERSGPELSARYANRLARWESSSDPSYEECVTELNTQTLSSEEKAGFLYEQGLGLCILDGEAVAFVRTLSPADGAPAVQLQATRWNAVSGG